MRLIDADKLCRELATVDERYESEVDWFIRILNAEPTIDAVERIEYEKMKDLAEQYKFEYECLFEDYKDIINNVLPNRVEVVRCKDCKFAEQCHKWIKFKGVDLDHRYNNLQFCSYGKREEE